MTPAVVLASTSPFRMELLRRAGIRFEAVAPGVEERLDPALDPAGNAAALALQKARAVAARRPGAIVIGADQVLLLDGRAHGKPAGEAEALAQLSALSGRTHSLVTGLAIVAPGAPELVELEETRLTMRSLSPEELRAYVATGEWKGCAGGYRFEERGVCLFERIEGEPTNIVGLPVLRLAGHLRRLGVPLFA